MSTHSAEISVVISLYNAEKYIGAAMPNIFAARSFDRKKQSEQERLLNEAYKSDVAD